MENVNMTYKDCIVRDGQRLSAEQKAALEDAAKQEAKPAETKAKSKDAA